MKVGGFLFCLAKARKPGAVFEALKWWREVQVVPKPSGMNIGRFLRRRAVALAFFGSISGFVFVVLAPAFNHAKTSAWRSSCQSNLKSIALACHQYQADNDGRFPPLSSGSSRGWTTLLARYGQPEGFSCPAGYKSSFSPSSDYFFNAQLATKRDDVVRDPAFTVAFGDGVDNGPTNSHYVELPTNLSHEDSPQRHHWGMNYAFADGHIKMVSTERFHEWMDYAENEEEMKAGFTRQCHYKFSPSESAFRPKAKTATIANQQKKPQKNSVQAARSFPNPR